MVNAYLEVNERQTKNNSGGLVHTITPLERLERFLILGTVGGTYYVSQKELTLDNLKAVEAIIASEGRDAVDLIVSIGKSNRAPKHDPVLVAYAIACANLNTRAYALTFFNDIIRIGTHLFHFAAYSKGRSGWGRSFRRAVAEWYTTKDSDALALQLVKYKQRDGYSHRDILRLSHPQPTSQTQNGLLKYAVTGTLEADDSRAHEFVSAVEAVGEMGPSDIDQVVGLINEYRLPREVLPTSVMKNRLVWEALAPSMGLTALLRNLRNMSNDGYLTQGSEAVKIVRERLLNENAVRKARIHPAHVFLAKFNAEGIPKAIQEALEDMFFLTFSNVEPTNKRIMLALDVSASMSMNGYGGYGSRETARTPTAREWSALQALVTARVEPYAEFRAFSDGLIPLNISRRDSFESIVKTISNLSFSATDCSLPMFEARRKGEFFDAFAVYTDNETNTRGYGYGARTSGDPMNELRLYRQSSGVHDAKLAVVGITATNFSIADPKDKFTLDFVGFDANAPAVMADFIRQ
jgi:60 kDa SS-A/Ro ribonucleoprotein